MKDVVLWEDKVPVTREVAKRTVLQCGTMRLVAEVAKLGIDEISDVHGYMEQKVVTTLHSVESLQGDVTSERESTPLQEIGRIYRTQVYLDNMTRIAEATGTKIVTLTNGFLE